MSENLTKLSSSDSGVQLGPAKAVVAAVLGGLVGGLTSLNTALADGAVDAQEWSAIALAFILGTGLVGTATWATKTSVTLK